MTKYIYDVRGQTELFLEECKIKFPDVKNPNVKINGLTDAQRQTWLIDILNRYGKQGWRYVGVTLNARRMPLYILEKVVVEQ